MVRSWKLKVKEHSKFLESTGFFWIIHTEHFFLLLASHGICLWSARQWGARQGSWSPGWGEARLAACARIRKAGENCTGNGFTPMGRWGRARWPSSRGYLLRGDVRLNSQCVFYLEKYTENREICSVFIYTWEVLVLCQCFCSVSVYLALWTFQAAF